MPAPDEAQEVASVARGDRAAFAPLMMRHAPAIEAYATRVSGNPSIAQDVVQEVMLRFWSKAATFNANKARLTTWLHRIAHNLCIDHLRSSSRFVDRADAASEATDEWGAANSKHTQWQSMEQIPQLEYHSLAGNEEVHGDAQTVSTFLLELPERQRNALVLTYYQDLSNREVAEIMGLGTRAVESLLVRARAALKQRLEKDLQQGVAKNLENGRAPCR